MMWCSWAVLALVFQLLATLQVTPSPPGPAPDPVASALALADARARWARALDAHRWDRTHPAVRAEADAITAALVPSLDPPTQLHTELLDLLSDLGGDGLEAWLHGPHPVEPRLVAGYLERHHDPGLVASALAAGIPVTALAVELSRTRADASAPLLGQVFRGRGPVLERDELCRAALRLPARQTADLAEALVEGWRDRGPDESSPHCTVLGAQVPAGRAALARALARTVSQGGSVGQHLVAGLALTPTEQRAVADRAVQALLRAPLPDPDLFAWEARARAVGAVAPWFDLEHPRVRRDLRRVADLAGPFEWNLAPALLRVRDQGLFEHALETLRTPHLRTEYVALAMLYVGLLLPSDDAAANARVVATFQSLRRQLQDLSIQGVQLREVDQWLEAFGRTAACRDAPCLAGLVARGTDEAAARAAFLLGPAALASLPPDAADALVRRVVLRTSPALVVASLLGVRGCPSSLRGLSELARGEVVRVRGLMLDPWAVAFERACRADPGGRARPGSARP